MAGKKKVVLTAEEEPIKIYIYPFLAKKNVVSHAAMRYKDESIDYGTKGFNEYTRPHEDAHVYYLYPSEIGVDPKKLVEAIKRRKKIVKGSDYGYLGQNCAKQVIACLEEAGAKDISKPLGISVPTVPIFDDLEDWAQKNGHYKGIPLSEDKAKKYKREFTECLEILGGREEYRKKMEDELRVSKTTSVSEELKNQNIEAFNKVLPKYMQVQEIKPDYELYVYRKNLLKKSDAELLERAVAAYQSVVDYEKEVWIVKNKPEIVTINATRNSDYVLQEELRDIAIEKSWDLSDKVWNRLSKEGILSGERIIKQRDKKNIKKDTMIKLPDKYKQMLGMRDTHYA